jgi:uncharacterized protein
VESIASNSEGISGRERPMKVNHPRKGYAFNRTRQAFLATELSVADSHWTRVRGLMGTPVKDFDLGHGLWIVPSQGVHTLGLRYPIDLVYLSEDRTVLHVEENVKPWRIAPMLMDAATVLELPCHTVWNTATAVGDRIELGFVDQKKPAASDPDVEFRPGRGRKLAS